MKIRAILVAAFLIAYPELTAQGAPNDIVKYRQSLMKAMGAYMSAMSAITKGTVPFRADLSSHAGAVKNIAHSLPSLFPAGTRPDKTRTEARREVWSKPAEFTAAETLLEKEAEKMQQLAGNAPIDQLATQYKALNQACSSCHDHFRVKDQE